jgi:methyl-accepting chemotaxis protein
MTAQIQAALATMRGEQGRPGLSERIDATISSIGKILQTTVGEIASVTEVAHDVTLAGKTAIAHTQEIEKVATATLESANATSVATRAIQSAIADIEEAILENVELAERSRQMSHQTRDMIDEIRALSQSTIESVEEVNSNLETQQTFLVELEGGLARAANLKEAA